MFEPSPTKIVYAYGQFNNLIPKLQNKGIIVHEGVPTDELINSLPKNSINILDDLMLNLTSNFLTHLFTRFYQICLLSISFNDNLEHYS